MQAENNILPNNPFEQNGAYFLTMVTKDRADLFGEMDGDLMRFNALGKIVREEWVMTGMLRAGIKIDHFILMPNHLHAIVFIHLKKDAIVTHEKVLRGLLGRYRKITTEKAALGQELWEPNFYERQIRNQSELQAFRDYIVHNPLRWRWDHVHLK